MAIFNTQLRTASNAVSEMALYCTLALRKRDKAQAELQIQEVANLAFDIIKGIKELAEKVQMVEFE